MCNKVYYSTWEEVLEHLKGEKDIPPPEEERLFIEIEEGE